MADRLTEVLRQIQGNAIERLTAVKMEALERERRKRAQDIVDAYKRTETGRATPRQRELHSEEGPSTTAMENLGEMLAGPREESWPIKTKEDALAQLGGVVQAGTPEYAEYAQQIQGIRDQAILAKIAPTISRTLGVTEEEIRDMGIEGVTTILQVMRTAPNPSQLSIQKLPGTDEEGNPIEQAYVFDPDSGGLLPIPGARKPTGGPSLEVTGPEGFRVSYGGVGAKRGTLAAGHAEDMLKYERQERIARRLIPEIARLHRAVREADTGGAFLGTLGSVAGATRSAIKQLEQLGMTFGGTEQDFRSAMQGLDREIQEAGGAEAGAWEKFSTQVEKNSQIRTAVMNIATLVARMDNPGETRITDVQYQNAIRRLGLTGDPDQWAIRLKEVAGFILRTLESDAEELFGGERSVMDLMDGPSLIELGIAPDEPLLDQIEDLGPVQ